MAKEVVRTKMTDAEVEKFLAKYVKDHGWSAAEAHKRIRHCAATRWGALDRYAHKKPKKAAKAKKAKK